MLMYIAALFGFAVRFLATSVKENSNLVNEQMTYKYG